MSVQMVMTGKTKEKGGSYSDIKKVKTVKSVKKAIEVQNIREISPNVDMARLSYGLMAALLVACSFTTLVYADVQIGEITVSDTAARYDGVSEAVCEIFAAMDFEPYDWYDDDEFVECL